MDSDNMAPKKSPRADQPGPALPSVASVGLSAAPTVSTSSDRPTPSPPLDRHQNQTLLPSLITLAQQMAAVTVESNLFTRGVNELPVELIERIFTYLKATRDQSRVSRVSRGFRRIMEPVLYQWVELMVARSEKRYKLWIKPQDGAYRDLYPGFQADFTVPTAKGCNALSFLRTITDRPELATHVKYMWLHRYDHGYVDRLKLGLYGWEEDSPFKLSMEDVQSAMRTGKVIASEQIGLGKHVVPTEDEFSRTVFDILCRLTHLENLIGFNYCTDVPWNPITDCAQHSSISLRASNSFSALKQIHLDFDGRLLCELTPILTLPRIENVRLDNLTITYTDYVQDADVWKAIQTCSIKNLYFHNLDLKWWHEDDQSHTDPLSLLAGVVTNLNDLEAKTTNLGHSRLVLAAFKKRIDRLFRLSVTDISDSTSFSTVGESSRDWYDRDAALDQVYESSSIRILELDIDTLISTLSISEFQAIFYELSLDTVHIEKVGGQDYVIWVNLPLPAGLELLQLNVEDCSGSRHGLICALKHYVKRCPVQTKPVWRLEIIWQLSNLANGARVLPRKLIRELRSKGVIIEEKCDNLANAS